MCYNIPRVATFGSHKQKSMNLDELTKGEGCGCGPDCDCKEETCACGGHCECGDNKEEICDCGCDHTEKEEEIA